MYNTYNKKKQIFIPFILIRQETQISIIELVSYKKQAL